MQNFADNLNYFTSLGTIIGQVLFVVIIGLIVHVKFANEVNAAHSRKILHHTGEWGIHFAFAVAVTGVALSLVYSQFVGYPPCELCWIQRIFLYPQVIILGLAIWKKTKDAKVYCLTLSSIGAVVAFYNFYGQSFNPNALPACDIGGAASCAVRFFVEFGYVTIPLMSFTVFVLIITSLYLSKEK